MQCPHCHHKTNKSQILKCSHCGQSYKREHFEEFQYLEFLYTWIRSQESKLGDQTGSLLEEVELRQAEVLQLLGIYLRPVEQVTR
jgi:transcription elongation factor Elf1